MLTDTNLFQTASGEGRNNAGTSGFSPAVTSTQRTKSDIDEITAMAVELPMPGAPKESPGLAGPGENFSDSQDNAAHGLTPRRGS